MTDDDFLAAFEKCSLPRSEWTHVSHVRMAWLYLTRENYSVAEQIICEGIKRYNASSGNFKGYHETMTRAYARIISHCIRSGTTCKTFAEFAEANPDLVGRSKLLLGYYSEPRLMDGTAAVAFVPPDLKPLP